MRPAPVSFDGVWKRFTRGERHDSLGELFAATAKAMFRRRRPHELGARDFWAVEDVSFRVEPGEALAVIGPNGAGKSTTLKLLTKILRPTKGHCRVTGRVGALIEVAAGFHPDLTGRENVFLQGAIMGMKRAEIAERLDDIVDFAGVHTFMDTPVKRYSSGMNARLGFSIAAHLNPDVMIIDEVLSVGDAAYQERCVRRMEEFKKQGVTIVFVSHNLQAVAALCDRALLLKQKALAYGPTEDVLRTYVQTQGTTSIGNTGGAISISEAVLCDESGSVVDSVSSGQRLTLKVTYAVTANVSDVSFGLKVHRATDRLKVFDSNYPDVEVGRSTFDVGDEFTLHYHFSAHLGAGSYFVTTYVHHNPTMEDLALLSPAGLFSVDDPREHGGIANLGLMVVTGRDGIV